MSPTESSKVERLSWMSISRRTGVKEGVRVSVKKSSTMELSNSGKILWQQREFK